MTSFEAFALGKLQTTTRILLPPENIQKQHFEPTILYQLLESFLDVLGCVTG